MTDQFKTKAQLRGLIGAARFLRYTRPLRKRLGLVLGADGLYEAVDEMASIIDSAEAFNAAFAHLGWICHGWASTSAIREALSIAHAGDLREAEEVLANATTPESVRLHLMQMRRLRCFEKRGKLALLAAEDYEAGRYHACIPVVLALLDGMGQELTGAGFLRQGARFVDDDSFLDIGPGFAQLVRAFTQSRGGTSTDELRIPYRHGILHGVDLNYANKLVAAKAWSALFAAGYYAESEEERRRPSEEPRTLLQSLAEYSKTRKNIDAMQVHMERWEPRPQEAVARRPEDALPDTPEDTLRQFLEYWRQPKPNYGKMALLVVLEDEPASSMAGRLRTNLPQAPDRVLIHALNEQAPAAAWLECEAYWGEHREGVRLRMLYSDQSATLPSNSAQGTWKFLNLWPWEAAGFGYRVAQQSREQSDD